VVDGRLLGTGVWTAHGERQRVWVGRGTLWDVYLPLIRKGGG